MTGKARADDIDASPGATTLWKGNDLMVLSALRVLRPSSSAGANARRFHQSDARLQLEEHLILPERNHETGVPPVVTMTDPVIVTRDVGAVAPRRRAPRDSKGGNQTRYHGLGCGNADRYSHPKRENCPRIDPSAIENPSF